VGSPHHSHATVEISVEVGVLASAVLMEVFSWSKRCGTSAKIWRPTWIRATVYFMDLTYGIINNSCLLLYIYIIIVVIVIVVAIAIVIVIVVVIITMKNESV